MIDAGAIEKIVQLARSGFAVSQAVPDKILVGGFGSVKEYPAPPPLRRPTLNSMGSLLNLIADPAVAPAPEIYHSHQAVRVFLNRELRTEQATLPLVTTMCFQRMVECSKAAVSFPINEAVRWLRTNFLSEGNSVSPLLASLRRVEFVRRTQSVVGAGHGVETFGKSIEASVAQADDIPEEIEIKTRVYNTPGCEWVAPLMLGLRLDVGAEEITFYVSPDEIASAIDYVQGELALSLANAKVPTFYGSPA